MHLRPHLTYANVMSTVGVFIALGGTSFAAVKLSAKSVGERELKEGAVTGAKVRDGAIGAADLVPGLLSAGPRGPRGADGPAGNAGVKGDTGATGARGPSDGLFAAGAGGTLPGQANVRMASATLSNVPGGNYIIVGTAQIGSWEHAGFIARCWIRLNGTDLTVSEAVVGNAAGSTRLSVLAPLTSAVVPQGAQIVLDCAADQSLNPAPGLGNPRLAAIRVETLKK